ncbi:unnamed protein product [Gongylonema pulchrum]|uniref:AGC-kinase C-terminal domain-containing protein n=1 Tax=Gongylonema pulchrum TaxID=637853 RepID=A0A183EEQ1_9BILA|nr:unnamed protein product [Gongylonema pulchrum]
MLNDVCLQRHSRAISPFTDPVGKRLITTVDRSRDMPKRYFDALAGQSLGKRSDNELYESFSIPTDPQFYDI